MAEPVTPPGRTPSEDQPSAEAIAAALVEPVARRVVELLRSEGLAPRMLTAADVAAQLGRSRDWVYAHRSELGAVPLGEGARPRLGFPAERVADYRAGSRAKSPEPAAPSQSQRPRRRANGQNRELLPIRGGRAA